MTGPKFTPGPWTYDRVSGEVYGPKNTGEVVVVYDNGLQFRHDAHLIAAAPELYKALEQVLSVFGSRSQDLYELTRHIQGASDAREWDRSITLAAYAVLAKARGET